MTQQDLIPAPRAPRYRHMLTRVWNPNGPMLAWVCLNPSTAGPADDDPTTRKLRGFAERWGFGRFVLVNLFPLCATDPKELHAATPDERIGRYPLSMMQTAALRSVIFAHGVVLAWGANGSRYPTAVGEALRATASSNAVWHLGLTKDGQPKHPLYLPYDTKRIDAGKWMEANIG